MQELPPAGSTQPKVDDKLSVGSLTYTRSELAKVCFWLLLGSFAWALKGRTSQPIVQTLLSAFGENDKYSGVLIGSIPAIMVACIYPLLGYVSDHHRGKWGRRIPYVAILIPVAVVSLLGLAASPWLGAQLNRAVEWRPLGFDSYVIAGLTFFWMFFALADILGGALLGALINDVIPQRIIGRFFGAFRMLSLIAAMIYTYFLSGHAETRYVPILIGIAVVAAVGIGLMCLKVREGTYPAPPPEPKGWTEFTSEAKGYFQDCFGSPFYRLLFIAWGLGMTAWNPVNYYSVFIASGYITMAHYGNLLLLTFAISLALAYPLGVLADRFHPLRLGIVALSLYSLATMWGGFFATTPFTFDIAFVLHGVLSGTFISATASLLQRLLPRLKFAQFAAAAGVMVCLSNIAIIPIASFLFDTSQHDSRYIFLLSSVQGIAALGVTLYLYQAFLARGGDKHYTAPGDENSVKTN